MHFYSRQKTTEQPRDYQSDLESGKTTFLNGKSDSLVLANEYSSRTKVTHRQTQCALVAWAIPLRTLHRRRHPCVGAMIVNGPNNVSAGGATLIHFVNFFLNTET